MANHNKEKYLQFNSSTYRQDDSYQISDNMNKAESDIQAQVQDRKDMEVEHIIAKKLILDDESHEKLDNKKGIKVPEVERLLQHKSQVVQPLPKYSNPEKLDLIYKKQIK